jgi:hypothetical protein
MFEWMPIPPCYVKKKQGKRWLKHFCCQLKADIHTCSYHMISRTQAFHFKLRCNKGLIISVAGFLYTPPSIVHFLVLSHMFGCRWSKNYCSNREKVWFFLNLIFSAVRNFKFRHMFCRNKKFCSVKSRFLYICRNTNFGQYWLSTVYFLVDFNKTFRLLFFHSHLQICQVSFKNIQK